MLKKKLNIVFAIFFSFVFTIILGFSNSLFAQNDSVMVPRLTVIPAVATMELSSQSLFQGQNVNVTVANNFYYNNSLVVPLGSSINGLVTGVKAADKDGNDGEFCITFTNISTPYGHVIPISGMIKTDDSSGVVKGNVTKDNTDEVVKGAVKGSIAGTVVGGKNNRDVSRIGGAIGAGMAASATNKGRPAVISVGSVVEIILNQQSNFKVVQGYQY